MALVAALGWTSYAAFFNRLKNWLDKTNQLAKYANLIPVLLLVFGTVRDNTAPDAIVMDSEPWDLHFYSDRKTVHTPYDTMAKILWVMRTYGVTHITYNGQKSLQTLYSGEIPGFELVNERGMKIYQVQYDELPERYKATLLSYCSNTFWEGIKLMARYRAALIGCGGKGRDHANTLLKDNLVDLVALCDVREEALQIFKDTYGVSALYTDYRQMLEREKPDLVVISTQAPQHHALTVAAAEYGCHVLCEKPMALTLQEADEMIAACDKAGVRLAINHQKRASAYNDYTKKLIADGEIGELILIRAYDKGGRKAGNSMMEMGTHLFDWIHNFAGDVSWASAHINTGMREASVQDIKHSQEVNPRDRDAGLVIGERAFCSFGFVNGLHADCEFLAQSRANDKAYGLDLIGAKGRIALRRSVATVMFIHRGEFMTPVEGHQWKPVSLPEEDAIAGQHLPTIDINRTLQSRIIRSLLEPDILDAPPISSGRDGRAALEMIHGSWESHLRGGRVTFPLKDRTHPLQRWLD